MPEYEHSQTIQASPDAVFAFVSQVRNLPQYLPTIKAAEPQGPERVVVHGEARSGWSGAPTGRTPTPAG